MLYKRIFRITVNSLIKVYFSTESLNYRNLTPINLLPFDVTAFRGCSAFLGYLYKERGKLNADI